MTPEVQAYCETLKALVGDDDPVTILSATPSRIKTLICAAAPTALVSRQHPDKWSIAEIVAHLADSELVFAYRLRTILAVNGASLQAFDPDRWAATFDYGTCDVHTSVAIFAVLRMGTVRMLNRLEPALLDHVGTHEEWGPESVRSMVRLEAGHDRNHLAQIERILAGADAAQTFVPTTAKPEIPFGDADKVDLRVGTILDMIEVPNADRLMQLTVDFGSDRRTVVAGIRQERSDPRVLIGRQALFYYNLPKRMIRGHLSEAMLCDVGYADGIAPALLEPERCVPNGTRAG